MVEDVIFTVAADKYFVRFDKEAIESMLSSNFGMLAVHVKLKEPFEGGDIERFHFGRRRGIRFADFEVIAPEIFGFVVMGEDFQRFGAEDVCVEQLAAVVVVDVRLDLLFEAFDGFFETPARACEVEIVDVLRGSEDDEADERIKNGRGKEDLGRDRTTASQHCLE